MPDKLTDSEIVKALEYCTNCVCNTIDGEEDCPLVKMSFCKNYLMKQSLDLINRLEARIGIYETCNARKDEAIKHLEAENERLKGAVQEWVDGKCISQKHLLMIGKLQNEIEQAKSEAYKECIEKVKEKSKKSEIVCSGALVTTSYLISAKNLNNLLKEMVEGNNGK